MCPAGLDVGLLHVCTVCTRHAHAMHTPCTRHAHAMHTPCTCHAHAMHAPCTRLDVRCLLVRLRVYIVLTLTLTLTLPLPLPLTLTCGVSLCDSMAASVRKASYVTILVLG